MEYLFTLSLKCLQCFSENCFVYLLRTSTFTLKRRICKLLLELPEDKKSYIQCKCFPSNLNFPVAGACFASLKKFQTWFCPCKTILSFQIISSFPDATCSPVIFHRVQKDIFMGIINNEILYYLQQKFLS